MSGSSVIFDTCGSRPQGVVSRGDDDDCIFACILEFHTRTIMMMNIVVISFVRPSIPQKCIVYIQTILLYISTSMCIYMYLLATEQIEHTEHTARTVVVDVVVGVKHAMQMEEMQAW